MDAKCARRLCALSAEAMSAPHRGNVTGSRGDQRRNARAESRWARLDACQRGVLSVSRTGDLQSDPTTDGPGEEPGEPVPVRPSLGPVGDDGGDAHSFPEDEEPEDVGPRPAR